MGSLLHLLAAGDDYLLEQAVGEAVAAACAELSVDAPEILPDGLSAEDLTVEVATPSLFAPRRVLVVKDARRLLGLQPASRAGRGSPDDDEAEADDEGAAAGDAAPLVAALQAGVPDGVALVLAACCAGRPRGPLAELAERCGRLTWIPLPPSPKPWEETTLSAEQVELLRTLLRREAGSTRFAATAERLLVERLGFAPRLLVAEVRKLVVAAGPGGTVDEPLVRRLVLPRERSLEAARDAVLRRAGAPLHDLLAAASSGLPVTDWRGRRLDANSLGVVLLGLVAGLLRQLLELRALAAELGLEPELDPRRTGARYWSRDTFGRRVEPALEPHLGPTSSLRKGDRRLTAWNLSQLFAAAGRYREGELVQALATADTVEAQLRGPLPLAALATWLGRFLPPPPLSGAATARTPPGGSHHVR